MTASRNNVIKVQDLKLIGEEMEQAGIPCKSIVLDVTRQNYDDITKALKSLLRYPALEGIMIAGYATKFAQAIDLTILSELPNLHSLSVNIREGRDYLIDFSKFRLKEFSGAWFSHYQGLESLIELEVLRLSAYKAANLEDLSHMSVLHTLVLWDSHVPSLAGIERCTRLKNMDLFRIKGLTDLSPLAQHPSLERLYLLSNRSLTQVQALSTCPKLRKLWIEKCKYIADIATLKGATEIARITLDQVQSISFLPELPKLEFVYLEDVFDCDIRPLLQCNSAKCVWFPNKKKYNLTREEFVKEVGASFDEYGGITRGELDKSIASWEALGIP